MTIVTCDRCGQPNQDGRSIFPIKLPVADLHSSRFRSSTLNPDLCEECTQLLAFTIARFLKKLQ